MDKSHVRVRFAPSPTGELHIGGARTALFNYLFAQKMRGDFLLRIEDTDRERFVKGSEQRILEGLKWLGLNWVEGPDIGGPFGPYIQSQRLELYQKYAQELLDKGAAYYCFCTSERLEHLRQQQQLLKKPSKYDRHCLTISADNINTYIREGKPYVVRLRVPAGETSFTDLIRGLVIVDNETIDDQVLLKSDGFPTYHLANVIDDHLMAISHVIRGEEWLPSTPKHILLYKAFGWESATFAHLANVLNQSRAKLSKRKDGEMVWLQTYQKLGYLPEAMVNFLGLLGWHPKDDRELFRLDELAQEFSIDRVQKGGAIFNVEKLNWFNTEYIKKLEIEDLDNKLQPFYHIAAKTYNTSARNTLNLSKILQTRLIKLSDAIEYSAWYFNNQGTPTPELLMGKIGNLDKVKTALICAQELIGGCTAWEASLLKTNFEAQITSGRFTRTELYWPTRVAVTAQAQSPDVFDAIWALGKTESLRRIEKSLEII